MEVRSLCQSQIGPRGREQGASSKLMRKENNFSFQNGGGFCFWCSDGKWTIIILML